jgi:hypothetical protein
LRTNCDGARSPIRSRFPKAGRGLEVALTRGARQGINGRIVPAGGVVLLG